MLILRQPAPERSEGKAQTKPIKVLVACAMGVSSSLLEANVVEAAHAAGVPMELKAITTPRIARCDFQAHYVEVVLVAPQVRHEGKGIAQADAPYGIIAQDYADEGQVTKVE